MSTHHAAPVATLAQLRAVARAGSAADQCDALYQLTDRLSTREVRRPLAVVGIAGGLAQWEWVEVGYGLPILVVLDFDRDGATAEELAGLVADIDQVIAEVRARSSTPSRRRFLAELRETRRDYAPMPEGEARAQDGNR